MGFYWVWRGYFGGVLIILLEGFWGILRGGLEVLRVF